MKTSDVDHMLRDRVAGKRGVGIVAGMIESGGDAELTMVGERGTGELIDASTVFESGSLAKVFTGTLLADMVLRGEASLEDPVAAYLPDNVGLDEFRRAARAICDDRAEPPLGDLPTDAQW
jgi:serine-type D-Ala-D-Ala carboxypeptidase/endopeptidase